MTDAEKEKLIEQISKTIREADNIFLKIEFHHEADFGADSGDMFSIHRATGARTFTIELFKKEWKG